MFAQNADATRRAKSGRVEGNLIEYPIFHFHRGRRTAMSFVYEDDSRGVRRQFTVTNGLGLPGALAQDCLVALMLLREEQQSSSIHFYVSEVARLVFGSACNQKRKQLVKAALRRLAFTVLEFEEAFFDQDDGEYITTRIKPLFEESTLYAHRLGKNHMDARQENLFRLSEAIEKNIAASYFNYVVFEEYRKLPSGLPRRLFLYLTKKSNGGRRNSFTIRVRKLYDRLPITNKQPSRRFDCLEKTATAIERIGITHRYSGDTITFVFPDRVRKTIETAFEGSSLLRELIQRFYSTLGVETVSDRRMSAGLRVLREIGTEAQVDPATLGKIVDWVLERREAKFKGLHSINILKAVWDQALSDIRKRENAAAKDVAQKENARAADHAAVAQAEAKKAHVAMMRASLSEGAALELRAEATRRFETEPRLAFTRGMFSQSKTVCGMTLEEHVELLEDQVLLERAVQTVGVT